jgi:hypothetical protein
MKAYRGIRGNASCLRTPLGGVGLSAALSSRFIADTQFLTSTGYLQYYVSTTHLDSKSNKKDRRKKRKKETHLVSNIMRSAEEVV